MAVRVAEPMLLERRFSIELAASGNRVSGTAIRYGDIAVLSEGLHERFEPGAFSGIAAADVILDLQHQREMPLARTGGGGLTLVDTPHELRFEAVLPDTRAATDALELVRSKVLRGASVLFKPLDWSTERAKDYDLLTVQSAKLIRISLVDKPAYTDSLIEARSYMRSHDMTEDEIRTLVEGTLKSHLGSNDLDKAAEALTGKLSETVAAQARSISELQTELADAKTALDDAKTALDGAAEARSKAEEGIAAARAEAEEAAESRAGLLVLTKGLLPEGTDPKGRSNVELLRLAVGDEVEDAEGRSEDYLLAKVEDIAQRRSEAEHMSTGAPPRSGSTQQRRSRNFNLTSYMMKKAQPTRS